MSERFYALIQSLIAALILAVVLGVFLATWTEVALVFVLFVLVIYFALSASFD